MRPLKKDRTELKFFAILTALVVGLGAQAIDSLNLNNNNSISAKNSRLPASIDAIEQRTNINETTNNKNLSRPYTLEWDCVSTFEPLQVSATHLRLHGVNCASLPENLQVINSTNRFTATVIKQNKSFTTDFIDLRVGENLIDITLSKDSVIQLKVTRED